MTEKILETWPEPPQDAVDALVHTVDVFQRDGQPDDMQVIRATTGVYGPGVTTGLTLGDLRELVKILVDAGVYE